MKGRNIRRLWKIHCAGNPRARNFFKRKTFIPFAGKLWVSLLFSQTLLGPVLALRALVFACQNDPSCGAAKRKSTRQDEKFLLLGARQKTRFVFAFLGPPPEPKVGMRRGDRVARDSKESDGPTMLVVDFRDGGLLGGSSSSKGGSEPVPREGGTLKTSSFSSFLPPSLFDQNRWWHTYATVQPTAAAAWSWWWWLGRIRRSRHIV